METKLPRLENWCPFMNGILADVYDDERFRDGERIVTSPVVEWNRREGTVQTQSTLYRLGKQYEVEENGGTVQASKEER